MEDGLRHFTALESDSAPVDELLRTSTVPATRLKVRSRRSTQPGPDEAYHVFVNSRVSLLRMTRKLCTLSAYG